MDSIPNGQSVTDASNSENNISSQKKDVDLDFLPLIYEIIKSIEREPVQDTTGKSRENLDTGVKVLELEKKLNDAREQILHLPGIEHSKEEQLRQLDRCRQQVLLKQKLITKYRNFGPFSLSD